MSRETVGDEVRSGDLTVEGTVAVGDGSASAPSITNDGDTDTGLYFPAPNQVGITTNGSQAMLVGGDGKVTVSSGFMDINASTSYAPQLTATNSSSDGTSLYVILQKSRGGAVTQNNDSVANLAFKAHDGVGYQNAALIASAVDGTPGAGDMPGRLMFYTTPDGSTSVAERMRINNAGLITGSGTSLGAWTAYTPTLGGTGWALGDGTATGKYVQVGKIVHFKVQVIFGSTSTYGSAAPTLTLPVTAVGGSGGYSLIGSFLDVSAGTYYRAAPQLANTTSLTCYATSTAGGQMTAAISTVPFTWASTDQIVLTGTYEAA